MSELVAPAGFSPLLEAEYELQLFIAGASLRSDAALRNVQAICAQHLSGRHSLTVIDLQKHPERAHADNILGVPCLVKKRPGLIRRLVGDFSQLDRVLKALGLA
ncbi:circadian clock KaiB family protein [uncultured Hymenobacter sp.]|uniref:circadian clock KaiB family protein n=1 Tax=uncultured Hymenobacter sp. TaxID=170016 RepID=UPI0035CAA31E